MPHHWAGLGGKGEERAGGAEDIKSWGGTHWVTLEGFLQLHHHHPGPRAHSPMPWAARAACAPMRVGAVQAGQAAATWGAAACFRVEALSFAVAATLLLPLRRHLRQDPPFSLLASTTSARRCAAANMHQSPACRRGGMRAGGCVGPTYHC